MRKSTWKLTKAKYTKFKIKDEYQSYYPVFLIKGSNSKFSYQQKWFKSNPFSKQRHRDNENSEIILNKLGLKGEDEQYIVTEE